MPLSSNPARARPEAGPCDPAVAASPAPAPLAAPADDPSSEPSGTTAGSAHHATASEGPASRRELGRAHLWSGEPTRALEVLAPLHRSRPWDREVQSLMLDALFLLGLDEDDFPWTVEPVVARLGPGLMDRLRDLLRADGGQVSLLDLLVAVAEEGHPAFRSEELLDRLEQDERFAVRRLGLAPECAVVSLSR